MKTNVDFSACMQIDENETRKNKGFSMPLPFNSFGSKIGVAAAALAAVFTSFASAAAIIFRSSSDSFSKIAVNDAILFGSSITTVFRQLDGRRSLPDLFRYLGPTKSERSKLHDESAFDGDKPIRVECIFVFLLRRHSLLACT